MRTKLLNYAVINKYPMLFFVTGIVLIGVGMHQQMVRTEIVAMASVFGVLTLLTIAGIYFTRYVAVKHILERLDKEQISSKIVDANLISFSYKDDDYRMNLYASRGTTFVLFYKNGKLIANEVVSKENLSKVISLLYSDKELPNEKYKRKVKSQWL